MHVWTATFRVGDFGTKSLTITTEDRAAAAADAEGKARGGFAEVEQRALEATHSETNGWPSPIELVAIQYVDEVSPPKLPPPTQRKQG